MNQEVTDYIDNLKNKPGQEWQAEVCTRLRQIILDAVPDVTERIQYGKPHYLKNGKYADVLSTAKGWVTLMIFDANPADAPEGLFEPGSTTIKIRPGQEVDYDLLAKLIQEAASSK
jgi:hypothetical protein